MDTYFSTSASAEPVNAVATGRLRRQRLAGLMRDLHYGRVENLSVVDGDPNFEEVPLVVQEVKFGSTSSGSEADPAAYALKRQVVELFEFFDRLGTGSVRVLEIKGGLPFKVEAEKQI